MLVNQPAARREEDGAHPSATKSAATPGGDVARAVKPFADRSGKMRRAKYVPTPAAIAGKSDLRVKTAIVPNNRNEPSSGAARGYRLYCANRTAKPILRSAISLC